MPILLVPRSGPTVPVVTPVTYTFVGPTVNEAPAGGDYLFWRYKIPRGITLLQAQNGTWTQVRYPTSSDLAGALRAYRGGYNYTLTAADAAALQTAGFGAYVTTTGSTGYGSGPYGSGPYGG